MKKLFLLLLTCIFYLFTSAQNHEYVINNPGDSTYNCYLKVIPEGEIKGLLVRDYSKLPDITKKSPYKWEELALSNGLMVLYTSTTKTYPELYLYNGPMDLLDNLINEVVVKHNIPKDKIVIGGMSSSGTRAVRYTQYCEQGKSKNGIKIAGVFGVDPPLDNERFYQSSKQIIDKGLGKGHQEEAKLMLEFYKKNIGTGFRKRRTKRKFIITSAYTDSDKEGGNAKYLKDVPVRLYHEPDIDWWLKERNESYIHTNSPDIVGLINTLQVMGNKQAELITTTGKGYLRDGTRHPHSWTIVDEPDLINWIMQVLGY